MRVPATVALLVTCYLAGCAASPVGPTSPTATPTPEFSDRPDPDHDVTVVNEMERTVNVSLFVYRGDELVDRVRNRTQYPGGEMTVYNTRAADPEGIVGYRLVLRVADGRTARTEIVTNACFGGVQFVVPANGSITVGRGMC